MPSCFEDNIFNIEKFKQLLGEENNLDENEKYGLNWVGKSKSFYESTKDSNMTLIPLRNKSVNFDESDNIIIEGDNLEVLKLLEKSYFNKIDVIYIDPPYNTGNDFFVYKDDYSQSKSEFDKENNLINEEGDRLQTNKNQKSDGRIHTKWLSMIYPRLILAKKLLKDDGVIFISIDDNEQARLKLLCDEIFGEKNFVSDIIWIRNPGGQSDNSHIAKTKEYILIYAKNIDLFNIKDLVEEKKILDYKFDKNLNQYWKKGTMIEKGGSNDRLIDRKKLGYVVYYNPKLNEIKTQHDYGIDLINHNLTSNVEIYSFDQNLIKKDFIPIIPRVIKNTYGRWRMGPEKLKDLFEKNRLFFEKDKQNNWRIYEKEIFEIENPYKNLKPKDLISFTSNTKGTNQLKEIFPNDNKLVSNFHPKPSDLILYLINFHTNPNSLVLDFFAGSGTTAQAVMELNKEDGGNRKYILVQYPEESENLKDTEFETIADITRERVKRAIDMFQYKEKGYKAFKLVESNLKSFDASTSDPVDVIQSKFLDFENKIKENTSIENLIYEIILRVGELPLNTKIESEILYNNKVYYDELKYCLFLLEPAIDSNYYNIENIIKIVKNFYSNNLKIYLNDKYFENDQDKINFAESIKNIKDGSWEIELVVI